METIYASSNMSIIIAKFTEEYIVIFLTHVYPIIKLLMIYRATIFSKITYFKKYHFNAVSKFWMQYFTIITVSILTHLSTIPVNHKLQPSCKKQIRNDKWRSMHYSIILMETYNFFFWKQYFAEYRFSILKNEIIQTILNHYVQVKTKTS